MKDDIKLTFQYGWEEKDDEETPMKGYRSDGIVKTSEGEYSVYFIDPIRLQQDLEAETELGTPFLAEPGLIILPEVTREGMENAVKKLWEQGYFKCLKYLNAEQETIEKTTVIA
ncbi:hypothetical protein [Aphanothece sacrum]|uniref:Uncharacterized protein n=1 Tax=Aphanothece sacrum FPU1 TaxID=1920663 RepID=A0A401INN2_APHSA|nr:hypothetical protein [Aphanothece sacrum]GBF82853.1 hypothetical protein AsFPU1_4287 [Aphanothece sacrum FPU1]GBF86505.1 hypothetical protein AsFPU3_3576 [Aphanothece sacrum FPU3]